jgi:hypothetical protein
LTGRPQARWLLAGAATLAVLAAAAVALSARSGHHSTRTPAATPAATTARVVRTTLVSRQTLTGELGYTDAATLVNFTNGTLLTRIPAPGTVVRRGQPLYWLDGRPVVLLYGATPAWRAFRPGMADGRDLADLNANLTVLHAAPEASWDRDRYTWDTQVGLQTLFRRAGGAPSGIAPLGSLVFLPGPIRFGNPAQPLGAPLPAAATIATVTATTPIATMNVDPNTAAHIHPGDKVTVTLPTGATATAHVGAVNPVATIPASDNAQQQPTITVTIRFDHPTAIAVVDQAPVEVAITDRTVPNALAVPVTALLARPDGGYALETIETATAPARLLPVHLGLFDYTSGLVQISGTGLSPGLLVQAAAS